PPLSPPPATRCPYTTLFRSCQKPYQNNNTPCYTSQSHRPPRQSCGLVRGSEALPGRSRVDLHRFCTLLLHQMHIVKNRLTRNPPDRKSTRLNSSHVEISYAV